jgi:peptide/nickel transport system substrate-binding protein
LLDAAGWVLGDDGSRRKGGRVLRLPLKYAAGEPLTDRAAQMIKEDWRRIGVEVNLSPQDEKAFGDSSAANRAYQGLSLSLWIMDPSADGITFWTSASIPTDANPTGQNTCRWRNARSDELLFAATRTLDRGERVRLLREQQRIWADELPAVPLYFKQLPRVALADGTVMVRAAHAAAVE